MCGLAGAMPNFMNPYLTSNVLCSISCRLARARPKTPGHSNFRSHTRKAVHYLLGDWSVEGNYDELYKVWREENNYSESRKLQLDKIYDYIVVNWDGLLSELNGPKWPKWAYCKSFGKREFLAKDGKSLRSISSRSDLIKVLIGPYVHAMEKQMYDTTTKLGRHFFKHRAPEEQFDVIDSFNVASMNVLETDHTNFEGSISGDTQMACENQFYSRALRHQDKRILTVFRNLATQNVNCRYGCGKLQMKSIRMSGEMYTSLGNGLTNLIAMHYCVNQISPVTWDNFNCIVEGDDGLTNLPKTIDPKSVEEVFKTLGFEVTMAVHHDATLASFCGKVYNTRTRTIMTDPTYALNACGWSTSSTALNPDNLACLTALKGFSLRSQYTRCPVIWAAAARMIRTGGKNAAELSRFMDRYPAAHDVRQTSLLRDAICTGIDFRPPDDYGRALFASLYGIPISAQLRMEDVLNSGEGWFSDPIFLVGCPPSWIRNFAEVRPRHSKILFSPKIDVKCLKSGTERLCDFKSDEFDVVISISTRVEHPETTVKDVCRIVGLSNHD